MTEALFWLGAFWGALAMVPVCALLLVPCQIAQPLSQDGQ